MNVIDLSGLFHKMRISCWWLHTHRLSLCIQCTKRSIKLKHVCIHENWIELLVWIAFRWSVYRKTKCAIAFIHCLRQIKKQPPISCEIKFAIRAHFSSKFNFLYEKKYKFRNKMEPHSQFFRQILGQSVQLSVNKQLFITIVRIIITLLTILFIHITYN